MWAYLADYEYAKSHPGEFSVKLCEVDRPAPSSKQVLIRTAAAGLNRADLLQARGFYPPPPSTTDILGLELAGEVVEVGEGVAQIKPGQQVAALVSGGAFAEYCLADVGLCFSLPSAFPIVQAAAIPEAWITAFLNCVQLGQIRAGQRVLIHAGASGVGVAAIQIAKATGCEVAVTASTTSKLDFAHVCGANFATTSQDFLNLDLAELEATLGGKFNFILDCVGASYLPRNLALLSHDGALACIGLMGGKAAEIDLSLVLSRRIKIFGSTLRPLSLERKQQLCSDFRHQIWDKFLAKNFDPHITQQFDFSEVNQALELMRTNQTRGKVVLTV